MKYSVILIKEFLSNEPNTEVYNYLIQRGLIEFCLYTLTKFDDHNLTVCLF